jgi:hypothetical protein
MRFIFEVVRSLVRIIATFCLLAGLMAIGFLAVVVVRAGEGLSTQILGRVWFQHDPFAFLQKGPSIQLFQVFFERKLGLPVLWDPVILTILNWPSWIALAAVAAFFLIPAAILFGVTRRRRTA